MAKVVGGGKVCYRKKNRGERRTGGNKRVEDRRKSLDALTESTSQ